MSTTAAVFMVALFSLASGDSLYKKYTSQPPRQDGRCGPFFGGAGCWQASHCSDFGWCHPIDNTTLTTWVGNFHYDGQMQNLGNCMDLPGNSNGACNIAMPAGAMPGTMCCDMFISHFHGHYCAFSPPDMDVCHVDTNFNDAVPTLATPGPTPAATNGGGATPKPTPAADSRVSTSSAQTALPPVLVVAVAMLYVIAL